MTKFVRWSLVLLLAGAAGAAAVGFETQPPPWAFPLEAKSAFQARQPAQATVLHVPGSRAAFTLAQVNNLFFAPDWRPEGHPPMPAIVAIGREPGVYACGYCHLPNGAGRPANASLAGLSVNYIEEQVREIATGRRRSSVSGLRSQSYMAEVAANARPDEVAAAASYFASLIYHSRIQVVETNKVPRTRVTNANSYEVVPGRAFELLGQRIIEVAESPERMAARDPASGFIAYVPIGSVSRGEKLVKTGGERTIPCAICHGSDLKGLADTPPLAGRSPSYIARQLFDLRSGSRSGPAVALMQAPAMRLNDADVVDIAAYLGSLRP